MTTTIDYCDIAGNVLRLAANLDQRMEPDSQDAYDEQKAAWARTFDGLVWPTEAESAVIAHYRDPRAFPLLPGNVTDFCSRQPPWSSAEHAREWVFGFAVKHPYAYAIPAYAGIPEPEIVIPESVTWREERQYLIDRLTEWATPRIDEIVAAMLAKQFRPQRADV